MIVLSSKKVILTSLDLPMTKDSSPAEKSLKENFFATRNAVDRF